MKLFLIVIFSITFVQGVFSCAGFNGLGNPCAPCFPDDLYSTPPVDYPNLACIQGSWQCPSKTQLYDANLKVCRGLSSSSCNMNYGCVDNANCVSGLCECNAGFQETSEGFCMKSFGDICTVDEDCIFMAAGTLSRSLVCDGVCKCPPGDVFRYNQTCEKAVGSSCMNDTECQMNSYELICDRLDKKCKCPFLGDVYTLTPFAPVTSCRTPVGVRCGGSPCVDNAMCYIPDMNSNKCRCIDGFELDNNGACVPKPTPGPSMDASSPLSMPNWY